MLKQKINKNFLFLLILLVTGKQILIKKIGTIYTRKIKQKKKLYFKVQ